MLFEMFGDPGMTLAPPGCRLTSDSQEYLVGESSPVQVNDGGNVIFRLWSRERRALAYEFARYLKVRGAWGASWSPDGRRLAFLTEITGVPQVWR